MESAKSGEGFPSNEAPEPECLAQDHPVVGGDLSLRLLLRQAVRQPHLKRGSRSRKRMKGNIPFKVVFRE